MALRLFDIKLSNNSVCKNLILRFSHGCQSVRKMDLMNFYDVYGQDDDDDQKQGTLCFVDFYTHDIVILT